jgi:hypothetical protein
MARIRICDWLNHDRFSVLILIDCDQVPLKGQQS